MGNLSKKIIILGTIISISSVFLGSSIFAREGKPLSPEMDKTVLELIKDNDISAISIDKTINIEKAKLGEGLYFDTKLSGDNSLSCASCHGLDKGGVDRLQTSTGINGQKGPINSPTVFNSAHNFLQFWDGRAKDLAEQAQGPVENPLEMGEKWENVIKKLASNPEYQTEFDKIYNGNITKENAADAIAEFEKTLSTPDSDFDRYIKGDKTAINEQVARGFIAFVNEGCMSCHSGSYFGGNSFQIMNEEYFKDRGTPLTDADMGRYNVTKDEADKHAFKVPMLRNIAVTAPYFHDGSVVKLSEAVKKMAKYQLGIEECPDEQVSDIVAFLESLTGEYKGEKLK